MVREYGDQAPLTHSPFAAVDALQKLAHSAQRELAMTGTAYVQLDEDGRPVGLAIPPLEGTRPQLVEDWRVWYCHGCRFAGQPDGHVGCEHVIVPGRLKLFLGT